MRLEFDFRREARIMDTVAGNLKVGALHTQASVSVD